MTDRIDTTTNKQNCSGTNTGCTVTTFGSIDTANKMEIALIASNGMWTKVSKLMLIYLIADKPETHSTTTHKHCGHIHRVQYHMNYSTAITQSFYVTRLCVYIAFALFCHVPACVLVLYVVAFNSIKLTAPNPKVINDTQILYEYYSIRCSN